MVITVSGNAGSGKDTIANLLSQKLKLKVIKGSIRGFAKAKGVDILEFESTFAQKSDYWDKKLDKWQKEEVKKTRDCILVSMLGAYDIPEADLKVWLEGRDAVRAERIAKRDRIHKQKVLDYLRARDKVFRERIKRIYGIDFWDPKFYDLRIDTSDLTPEEIVAKILKKLNES